MRFCHAAHYSYVYEQPDMQIAKAQRILLLLRYLQFNDLSRVLLLLYVDKQFCIKHQSVITFSRWGLQHWSRQGSSSYFGNCIIKKVLFSVSDYVEWSYLWELLTRLIFGSSVKQQISLLYESSTDRFRTNLDDSQFISLGRRLKQSCPLSPCLFATAIEPPVLAIRQSNNIKGIARGLLVEKVSLYADDTLVYYAVKMVFPWIHNLSQWRNLVPFQVLK